MISFRVAPAGCGIDSLKSLIKRDRIQEFYVDLACHKLNASEEEGKQAVKELFPSLNVYIDNWLRERGTMHISLLGGFGTGKTWFCRHYAYIQLMRYLNDPTNERLPLLYNYLTHVCKINDPPTTNY
jgi:predicted NACHT family NTPase